MTQFTGHAASILLMFGVLPVWIAAGLADYFCHRATNIEGTSGTEESVLHALQFALVGFPVTLALFLDANAGFFLLAAICIVLHHAVAAVDLVYANPKRRIAPREQMIHSFLEVTPIAAFLLLAVLYWPQFLALFGTGSEAAHLAPQIRVLPLPYIAAALGGALFFNCLPYAEELLRCVRAAQRRRASENRP